MTDDDHIDCDNELNEAEDRILQLQAENEHLCNTIEATRQELADMLAGTLEGKLQDKLNRALTALRDLHDQQNGPPWVGHEKQWQVAYDKAGDVLEENDK